MPEAKVELDHLGLLGVEVRRVNPEKRELMDLPDLEVHLVLGGQ